LPRCCARNWPSTATRSSSSVQSCGARCRNSRTDGYQSSGSAHRYGSFGTNLAEIPGIRLISLQKGDGLEQRDKVPFAVEVLEDFDAGPDRFIDTAAAMACLDLVVTIDTSVAHLAGALDVPTIILIKHVGADWRWLFKRDDDGVLAARRSPSAAYHSTP
jgi:hypothetical protein